MDISYKTLDGCACEVELRASTEELQPKFEEAYKEHQPQLTLRGFRKGKVPMHLVRQMFGAAIEHETLERLANEEFKKLVEGKTIQPIGAPVLKALEYKRGGDAVLRISYEAKPRIELKDFRGLKAERRVHHVTGDEAEREVERQRYLESTTHPADEIASEDFIVTFDAQKLDEKTGAPIIGKAAKDVKLYLRRERENLELKSALLHKHPGDTFVAPIYEETDGASGGNIEKTTASVTVKSVERVELPEMTEEFIARISNDQCKTIEEYRQYVRREMQRQWDERAETRLRDALADEYVRMHDFPVPAALKNEALNSLQEDYKRSLGMDARYFDEAKFRDEMSATAIWQAKWMLLREALAEHEHLAVEDRDIEDLAERDHQKLGIEKERLLSFYKTSEQMREKILANKVAAMLRAAAVVTDVNDPAGA